MFKLIFLIAILPLSCGSEPIDEMLELTRELEWIVCREEPEDEDGREDCSRIHEARKERERLEELWEEGREI